MKTQAFTDLPRRSSRINYPALPCPSASPIPDLALGFRVILASIPSLASKAGTACELLTVLEVIVLAVPGVILLAVTVLRRRRP